MKILQFSIKINSTKQKVWQTLWEDKTFRDWANIIDEGTYILGEMKQGQTIQFLSASGYGVTSIVHELVPNERVVFRHMADTKDNGDALRDDEWSGGTETHVLTEKDGVTILTVTTEVPIEMVEIFEDRMPKVLERIKVLAED